MKIDMSIVIVGVICILLATSYLIVSLIKSKVLFKLIDKVSNLNVDQSTKDQLHEKILMLLVDTNKERITTLGFIDRYRDIKAEIMILSSGKT